MKTYFGYMTEVFDLLEQGMKDEWDHFHYNSEIANSSVYFKKPFQMLKDLDHFPQKYISDFESVDSLMQRDYNAPSFELWEMRMEIEDIISEAMHYQDLEYDLENGIGLGERETPDEAARGAQAAYDHDKALLREMENTIKNTKTEVIEFCLSNGLDGSV